MASACLVRNPAPKGVVVGLLTGQSVQTLSAGDPVGPYPTGSYWSLSQGSVAFQNFRGNSGFKDNEIARQVVATGYAYININLSIVATSSAQWTPGGSANTTMLAQLATLLPLLTTLLAGAPPVLIHLHDQGEFEVNLANPSGAALVNAWASNTLGLFSQLDALLGPMRHVVTWTKIPQPVNNWGPQVRVLQSAAAGSSTLIIDRDADTYGGDNIHLSNPTGEVQYGAQEGQKIVQVLGL